MQIRERFERERKVYRAMQKYSLQDMQQRFPDDDTCLEWLRQRLYPAKIYCRNCHKSTKHHRIVGRKVYGCDNCGHQISPAAGTIFDHSPTPLTKWFYAIYIMSQTSIGISAKQLERELGVTYKTAWRMFKLIRGRLDEDVSPFSGYVEVDETYVGGPRPGKHGHCAANKTPVVGAVERLHGRVKAIVVDNTQSTTVVPFIAETVEHGSDVYTDECRVHDRLHVYIYNHYHIHHAAKIDGQYELY